MRSYKCKSHACGTLLMLPTYSSSVTFLLGKHTLIRRYKCNSQSLWQAAADMHVHSSSQKFCVAVALSYNLHVQEACLWHSCWYAVHNNSRNFSYCALTTLHVQCVGRNTLPTSAQRNEMRNCADSWRYVRSSPFSFKVGAKYSGKAAALSWLFTLRPTFCPNCMCRTCMTAYTSIHHGWPAYADSACCRCHVLWKGAPRSSAEHRRCSVAADRPHQPVRERGAGCCCYAHTQ